MIFSFIKTCEDYQYWNFFFDNLAGEIFKFYDLCSEEIAQENWMDPEPYAKYMSNFSEMMPTETFQIF